MPSNAAQVVGRVNTLASRWQGRELAVRKWYNLLRLENDLYQKNMESVISNDPRTGFNMALYLLTPKVSKYTVDTEGFTEEQITDSGLVEDYADNQLRIAVRQTRASLHGSTYRRILSLMLATGWYSIMSYPTPEGWVIQVWNPMSVYPEYNADGRLIELGRAYTVTADEANRKVVAEGWISPSRPFTGDQRVSNHWQLRDTPYGVVATHEVAIGTHLAKPEQSTPFSYIPVFVAPVGGLPDDGSIMHGTTGDSVINWRAEVGQGILAAVADIQKNYDKTLTYMQQLLRDTSNPRYYANLRGSTINQDDWYKRGAFFELEEGEFIKAVEQLAVPPEIRSHLFDIRTMMQRGGFNDAAFGAANISAFAMSQVVNASKQTLEPFQNGLQDGLSSLATRNIGFMRYWNDIGGGQLTLDGKPFPRLPQQLELNFKYQVIIPGDFMSRANSARVLNPAFRLSFQTLVDNLFPEIKDSLEEMRRLGTEDAVQSPEFKAVQQIQEMLQAAQEARQLGDTEFATRLEKMAQLIEARITQPQLQQGMQGGQQNLQALVQGA